MLRVSTNASAFRVEFYRYGAELVPMAQSGWLQGAWAPPHLPHQDWGRPNQGLRGEELAGWPAYPMRVPPDWPSGVYLAVFIETDRGARPSFGEPVHSPDARGGRCLFVVRAARRSARILYKIPLLTYHAYNQVLAHPCAPPARYPGWCLYTLPDPDQLPGEVPPSVSVRRPGGGTGGTPWDVFNFDPFDPTPRQTFAHWDAPFIRWLERSGYRLDYCTDLDLHRGEPGPRRNGDASGYRLLVSAGHDEYWSEAMREHADRFVRSGGNIAFFGGNTCWWRVSFDGQPPGDALTFRRVDNWPDRPENQLTGVSFRNGGERDRDEHPVPVGYRVQHADHWVYAGTGLREGEEFGGHPKEYLVGYECDGAHFDRAEFSRGRPARPTGEDGTPEGFTILGIGDTSPSGWGLGNRAATLGLHQLGRGTVFTAATTDWPRVLASGCATVETITHNVLEQLG